jgi:hypothetical protein
MAAGTVWLAYKTAYRLAMLKGGPMDTVYRTNWIAKTRRRAAWVLVFYFAMLIPAVDASIRADPATWLTRGVLALAPLLLARLCWRFLAEAEARHETPTPEMEFVFRLMTAILIVLGGLVGVALVSL